MDAIGEKPQEAEQENIIRTKYWDLPESSLDGWRPFSAYIDYRLLIGPPMHTHDKGLNLYKDLMRGFIGARGSGKSNSLTFFTIKKMRAGKTAWTNYPISFYVIEPDGSLTYYESQPLDVPKLCKFSPELRRGVVSMTELQYYVEARTSGRLQNRMLSYQIMQIRKTANSFYYDVQDQAWVDKRFGWSNDFDIECADISKMNYDRASLAGVPDGMLDKEGWLREGAISSWSLRDTSGVLTGIPFKKSREVYEDIQFDAWYFWDAFPTHFIVDAYEALHTLKPEKDEREEKRQKEIEALEVAINELLQEGSIEAELWEICNKAKTLTGIKVSSWVAGSVLKQSGVTKKQKSNGVYLYQLSNLLDDSIEGVAKR